MLFREGTFLQRGNRKRLEMEKHYLDAIPSFWLHRFGMGLCCQVSSCGNTRKFSGVMEGQMEMEGEGKEHNRSTQMRYLCISILSYRNLVKSA